MNRLIELDGRGPQGDGGKTPEDQKRGSGRGDLMADRPPRAMGLAALWEQVKRDALLTS
jgi:hypothetical protein